MTFANEHRFAGKPDLPPARDEKIHPLEPDTEEQYLALKRDAELAKEAHTALLVLESRLRNMSEDGRDEVEGHTGVWLEELQEKSLPGIVKARRELAEAINAWECRT